VVYSDDSSHDLINYYFFNCFRFTQAGSEVSALLGNKSTRSSSFTLFDLLTCIQSSSYIFLLFSNVDDDDDH